MQILSATLWIIFIALQYQLWMGEHSLSQLYHTKHMITNQLKKNNTITQRNQKLSILVVNLQHNTDKTIEDHAREELGMIAPRETFYYMPKPNNLKSDYPKNIQ